MTDTTCCPTCGGPWVVRRVMEVECIKRLCPDPFHTAPTCPTTYQSIDAGCTALDALASQLKEAREERDRWETTATHLLDRAEAAEAQAADALAVCEEHRQAWLDAVGAAPWCEECGMRYDGKTALCPRCTKLARVAKAADALAAGWCRFDALHGGRLREVCPARGASSLKEACDDMTALEAAYREATKEETP